MDSISGTASEEATSKFQASCPYIGMVSDPQTHVGIPDTRNYCHLVSPARGVVIGHQQGFCLGQNFAECPVYKSSGEDNAADGIFEAGERSGRGFGLFHLGRKARGKPAKQEIAAAAAVAVPLAAAARPSEPVPETIVKPVVAPEPKPVVSPVPSVQADLFPETVLAADTTEAAVPVDEDEELRLRLYNEALSRYEQVNNNKKERKGVWIFLMIAAFFVLAVSIWGIFTRSQNLLRQSQVEAEIGYTRSLATAVQDMSAASDAWGTAAGMIDSRDRTATAVVFGTVTALQAGSSIDATASSAAILALTASPSSQVGICQSLGDARFEVISGPTLIPAERTLYQPGLQTPQATWVVQNSGDCGWSQILFWSVMDNVITQPIIKRNGQVVVISQITGQSLIAPGEQIELVLQFPASLAQRVYGEWVLVADGLSLVSQPHLSLKVDNWITLEQYVRPTSTRLARKTPASGGSGGQNPGDIPPTREAPPPEATPRE